MDKFEIIIPTPLDWKDYKNIRMQALAQSPGSFGQTLQDLMFVSDQEWQRRLEGIDEQSYWMFFAKVGGEVVGMLMGRVHEIDPTIANIYSVFILENFRRLGVAKILMEKLLDSFVKTGQIKTAQLEVVSSQTPAINFYHQFGFKEREEILKDLGDGRTQKRWIMEKQLA